MPAPPPTSEVDICNLALGRIGQPPVESIESPTTYNEEVCARHYAATRRSTLRSYVFNFAKKYDRISVDSNVTPAFGYNNAFKIPNDFLRLLALGDISINADTPPGLYDVVGQHIFTDEKDDLDTDSINVAYIFDQTKVGAWDALFVKLMKLELAKDMSYAFSLKESKVRALDQELKDVRLLAAAIPGQEKPPRRVERSKFRDRRRMGGLHRDATRHWI